MIRIQSARFLVTKKKKNRKIGNHAETDFTLTCYMGLYRNGYCQNIRARHASSDQVLASKSLNRHMRWWVVWPTTSGADAAVDCVNTTPHGTGVPKSTTYTYNSFAIIITYFLTTCLHTKTKPVWVQRFSGLKMI